MTMPEDTTPIRRRVLDATDDELSDLATDIRKALEGDSNDAEHDALANVAGFLGIEYDAEKAYAEEEED